MNDNDIRELLQADPDELTPLDPATVIAGAHRRRRTRGVITAGIASAAVAAVVAGSIYTAADQDGREPFAPPIAGTPSAALSTPGDSPYVFQNRPQVIGQLPPIGSVVIATHQLFKIRGRQWAVISQVPGEPEIAPFGWRATVGNDNIGDGTDPGIQSIGIGTAQLVSSVFNSPEAATVVYTAGAKAWYAKVYRLGGINGWVESSALVSSPVASNATPGPKGDEVSVFVYDANGRLLTSFGGGKDPLPK
jgi:hypothetical protein